MHQEFTRRLLFLLLLVGCSEESQILQVPSSIDSDSPDHRLLLLEDHLLLQRCQRLRLLQLMLLLVRNLCLGQTEVTEEVDQPFLSHHHHLGTFLLLPIPDILHHSKHRKESMQRWD